MSDFPKPVPRPDDVGVGYICCHCDGKIVYDFDKDRLICEDRGQIHEIPEDVAKFVSQVREAKKQKPRAGNGINR